MPMSKADTAAEVEATSPFAWPQNAVIKEYEGGCHCKKFRFKFTHPQFEEGGPKGMPIMRCNCSICNQLGLLNTYTPENRFEFTAGKAEDLIGYALPGKTTTHYHCPVCSSALIVRGGGEVAINVRAVDGIDIRKLKYIFYDGRNLS